MLLAVSGIVQATPSSETLAAEIGVPCVTRVLRRSPFGIVHGVSADLDELPPRVAR